MNDPVRAISAPEEIAAAAQGLRREVSSNPVAPQRMIEVFERWGTYLRGPAIEAIPGAPFLRLWLRKGSIEPILRRELGEAALRTEWREEGSARLGLSPLGVVGHWPAANVEIQPILSMTCGLLGGNGCLVRIPSGLVEPTRRLLERLQEADESGVLTGRVAAITFDHGRSDLQRAMAAAVDGAMIWGGADAIAAIRALPFPAWARFSIFGPRLSVAAMDADVWDNADGRAAWCQRIARDVWQFDQHACSSPQTLFLESRPGADKDGFIEALRLAFEEENRAHPRAAIEPAESSAICLARTNWLFEAEDRQAIFPPSPDWTILVGRGTAIPRPIQGRTLTVLELDDLGEAVSAFDGSVQTLGLAIGDEAREEMIAELAAARGVDRIVKLGRMHVFGSPWDGADLIRPMTRVVRHVPSGNHPSKETPS